jgi:peptidyl-prolyl cis-trans isomerase C
MVIIAAVGMCGLGGLACQKKKEASRRPDEEQTQKAEQKAQIPQPPKDALAIVGDEVITINDLEVRIRNQQPGVSELYSRSLEKKKYLLEQLVRTELLAREAREYGYDQDQEVQRIFKDQIINKLIEREIAPKIESQEVSDQEIADYYHAHNNEFNRPEVVRCLEILLPDLKIAKEVVQKASSLKPDDQAGFEALVQEYSQDTLRKAFSGNLGYFARDTTDLPKSLVEAAFGLKRIGAVSFPIKSERGWHVLKLAERSTPISKTLPEAQVEIRARIALSRRAAVIDKLVAQLRDKYTVQLFEENLIRVKVDDAVAVRAAKTEALPKMQ